MRTNRKYQCWKRRSYSALKENVDLNGLYFIQLQQDIQATLKTNTYNKNSVQAFFLQKTKNCDEAYKRVSLCY